MSTGNEISKQIDEILELDKLQRKGGYLAVLRLIQRLKKESPLEDHRNFCTAKTPKSTMLMTPWNHACIRAEQCKGCGTYFFDLRQVLEFIEKAQQEIEKQNV